METLYSHKMIFPANHGYWLAHTCWHTQYRWLQHLRNFMCMSPVKPMTAAQLDWERGEGGVVASCITGPNPKLYCKQHEWTIKSDKRDFNSYLYATSHWWKLMLITRHLHKNNCSYSTINSILFVFMHNTNAQL